MVGRTILHYRILAKLGEGGMGVVYRAEDTLLHREVALKFLTGEALDGGQRTRFFREAQAAAQLTHPNICPVYAIEKTDEALFLSMALLEGSSLAEIIDKGPLPLDQAVDVAMQIGNGLEVAHARGIVHRDITPRNVMVSDKGHVSVLDFGLALVRGESRLTNTGTTIGTAGYMSPEQAQGQEVDARTDIWSLGIVLFEMIAGRRPFEGDYPLAVLYGVVHEPIPNIVELAPGCSPELQAVMERALEKDPGRRYQKTSELVEDLEELLRGLEGRAEGQASVSRGSGALRRSSDRSTIARKRRARGAEAQQRKLSLNAIVVAAVVGAVLLIVSGVLALNPGWFAKQSALPEVKHVAVLPFKTFGGDEQTQALSDGLMEVLTAKLSQLEELDGLMVVPASEVRSRGIESVEEARRVFGVNLGITGSVQNWDRELQFTATLVDAETLRQLGATTFEIDREDLRSLRLGVISRVVNVLELNLAPGRTETVASTDTENAAAYGAYLEGIGNLQRQDIAGNTTRAVESFERAIAADPEFSSAYAWLGEAYYRLARSQNDAELAQQAIRTAETAVEKNGSLAIARAKLGEVYRLAGKPEDAVRELERATELDPRNWDVQISLGRLYLAQGRPEAAEAAYRRAVELRPVDWRSFSNLGVFLGRQGRYQESAAAFQAAIELTPDNDLNHRNLGITYQIMGRFKDSETELRKALAIEESSRTYEDLSLAYLLQGQCAEAIAASQTAVQLEKQFYRLWGNLARAYACEQGHEQSERQALQKAIELGEQLLSVTPGDASTRSLLADYWARLGDPERTVAEIGKIPGLARQSLEIRLQVATALHLAGLENDAMRELEAVLRGGFRLEDAIHHPSLFELRKNPRFSHVVESVRQGLAH